MDSNTMNKTTDVTKTTDVKDCNISGGKDCVILSEVSLKNPSPKLKMRTTYLDQSIMRKHQEVKSLGDRKIKNVN